MEHRDRCSIQMATALYGTHAHRPLPNCATFSCQIIIQFCSQLTTALFGGATICHTAIIFRTSPLPTRPSHDLMQWRVTYFSFILRHTQGLFSLLLRKKPTSKCTQFTFQWAFAVGPQKENYN